MQLTNKKRLGRGAVSDLPNRFEHLKMDLDPAVVQPSAPSEFPDDSTEPNPQTVFIDDQGDTVLTHNKSPDLGFGVGLNPYRGCEHGCAYCYARPYHEYLGFSAGLEFETKIVVKRRAPELLRRELTNLRWKPEVIALSGVTDCYQPAERHFEITRQCLRVLADFRQPVSLITKNYLITRDIDILRELAQFEAVHVSISITTLNPELAAKMEPRASLPKHRLRAIEKLARAGIPVGVNVAPVIPGLNDREMPAILEAARAAGATTAHYSLLRLPHGVKDVFQNWLRAHFPEKLDAVLGRVRAVRAGALNSTAFGTRLQGEGVYADQLEQIFHVFRERLGYQAREKPLRTEHFRRHEMSQLSLGLGV